MIRILIFIVINSLTINFVIAQASDKVLSLKDFYILINANHPIVKQANILNKNAKMEIRMARGGFDPKLTTDYEGKQYDKKTYYNLWNSNLKVPLWIGDFKVGYEQNSGKFLSPENSVPDQGLIYAGVEIPILQGLLMDARRSTLRQAQIFQNIAQAEQIKILNKILFSAAKDYWEWYFTYHQLQNISTGYQLAQERFIAVKRRAMIGDAAAIDTVEAKIAVQDRQIQLQQATLELKNATLIVSNYIWLEDETPVELQEDVIPEEFIIDKKTQEDINLTELLAITENEQPEIIKLDNKLKQLTIEQRLQQNMLLPKINVNYNFLTEAIPASSNSRSLSTENYKMGLSFEFPLFLRKERAKLEQVKIKRDQTEWELQQIQRDIVTEIKTSYNQLVNMFELINQQERIIANYQILRNAEQKKFENGESSLFLINSREVKLIESQVKLRSLRSKYQKAYAELYFAAGTLYKLYSLDK